MPERIAAAFVAVMALGAIGSSGAAGAQESGDVAITGTNIEDFPTVVLDVQVTGASAEVGLTEGDIEITENGDPVDAEITAISELSLDVVLALDTSQSMQGEALDQAKRAALQFVDQLPDTADVAVVGFGDGAQLTSPFTDDRDSTRDTINGLTAGGETALYDAVVLATERVEESDASRTAIVLLSDGGDTNSVADQDGAVASLDGLDGATDFFAVSLESGEANELALAALADAAEGVVVGASDANALESAYVDLGRRIANQFVASFPSTTEEASGTWEVTVLPTGATDSIELPLPDRPPVAPTEDEEAAPLVVESLVTEGTTGPFEQPWFLWVGVLLVAVALAVTGWVVLPASGDDRGPMRALRSDRTPVNHGRASGERIVDSVRGMATRIADRAVERSEQGRTIDRALDRAGLIMRSGEFVALVFGVMVLAGLFLYLVMGVVGLVLGLVLPAVLAPVVLRFLANRRNAKFADQLSDAIILMAGSLRSGFGTGQAISNVGDEMDSPIADEFQRAVLEMRLGRNVVDSLDGVAKRVENEDFGWVVDAIRIHDRVGGDLARILDKVAETIRVRNRMRRQVSALTAEGRLSGIVLASLPVVLALVLYASNPEYLEPLFTETVGRIMLVVAVGLLVAGALWLKKLVDVDL